MGDVEAIVSPCRREGERLTGSWSGDGEGGEDEVD